MQNDQRCLTRRDFIRGTVGATLAAVVGDEEARKRQLERAQQLHAERGAPRHADRIRRHAELRLHFQSGP